MPNLPRFPAGAAALLCLGWCASFAWAQGQPPAPQPVKFEGEIQGLKSGVLHLVDKEGAQWYVQLAPRGQARVVGSAHPNWLAPGMFVRFVGKFDKKGNSVAPVRELSVFTMPTQGQRPWGRGADFDATDYILGAYPEIGGGVSDLFADEKPDQVKKPEALTLKVVGRLTGAKNGKLTVAAGAGTVKVDLADGAVIAIDIADPRLARVGDRASGAGLANPAMKNQILANELMITTAEPLGAPVKPAKEKNQDDKNDKE